MTATLNQEPQLWYSMPGWGIAADLTPPEVVNARQVKVIRRLIVLALVVLVAACAGGYVVAVMHKDSASTALADAQDTQTGLQATARKYVGITEIDGTVSEVQSRVASLMQGDVDLTTFLTKVSSALPAGMTITGESLSISAASVTTGATGANAGSINPSGLPIIGSVGLQGTFVSATDVAAYVTALGALTGVVDVVPTSIVNGKGATYSMTFSLTSALLSHRFDHSISGTK